MPVINPLTRQQWYTLSGAASDLDLGERLRVNELLDQLYAGSVAVPTEDDDDEPDEDDSDDLCPADDLPDPDADPFLPESAPDLVPDPDTLDRLTEAARKATQEAVGVPEVSERTALPN
jgi:hypothetical protein